MQQPEGMQSRGCLPCNCSVCQVWLNQGSTGADACRSEGLCAGLSHLGQRVCKIWGEWPVDVGLQLAQVELNQLVILSTLVRPQVLPEGVCNHSRCKFEEAGQASGCCEQVG